MTATIASCDATDEAAVIVAFNSLSIDANDIVNTYTIGSKLFIVRVPIA